MSQITNDISFALIVFSSAAAGALVGIAFFAQFFVKHFGADVRAAGHE